MSAENPPTRRRLRDAGGADPAVDAAFTAASDALYAAEDAWINLYETWREGCEPAEAQALLEALHTNIAAAERAAALLRERLAEDC